MIAAGPGKGVHPSVRAGLRQPLEEGGPAQRRHGILPGTRSLEGVPARIDRPADVPGLARHADFPLHHIVVGLELIVVERPVLDRRSRGDPVRSVSPRRLAHDTEIPRVQPPALGPVVDRRATDRVHHRVRPDLHGGVRRVAADGRPLLLRLLHDEGPVADVVPDLVRHEVPAVQPGAGLEPDDPEARPGERERGHPSGRPHAHDYDVRVAIAPGHFRLTRTPSGGAARAFRPRAPPAPRRSPRAGARDSRPGPTR